MTSPIRVCQFVGNMIGGGVEAVVMNYYRHIDRSKVQFDFVATEASKLIPHKEIETLGGRIYIVPAYTNLFAFQRACRDLFHSHPEWKIVHSHMNALSVFPLREAKRAGVPVRIAHSHSTSGKGEAVRNAAKAVLKTQANRYPTFRFACTEHAGEWLFGDAPFEVVPNPIEFQRFAFDEEARYAMRSTWGITGDELVIGHVGRWAPPKNQIFLLHVLKELLNAGADARLVLVGEGPDRPAIEREAEDLGVEGQLIAPGYMDSARVYSGFDVFAFPSRYEGLGMAVMEAQAAGLPCVVSDAVPRDTDLTGRCRFFPIEDARVWGDAVLEAADSVCDRKVNLGAQTILRYDADAIAAWLTARYQRFYKEAVQ